MGNFGVVIGSQVVEMVPVVGVREEPEEGRKEEKTHSAALSSGTSDSISRSSMTIESSPLSCTNTSWLSGTCLTSLWSER